MAEPNEPRVHDHEKLQAQFEKTVGEQAAREIHTRRASEQSIWFGLGAFGIIGWAIAVPMLAGLAIGIWLDQQLDSRISWTLTLLLVGLVIGCASAWFWIARERREIDEEKRDQDE